MRYYGQFGSFNGAFGAAGYDTGNDCPVPTGIPPFGIITEKEHDDWCNCMYRDAEINKRCKLKPTLSDPFGTAKYIPLPWTPLGKAARALPGSPDWANKAYEMGFKAASTELGKVAGGGVGGSTSQVPASTGGPVGLATGGGSLSTRFQPDIAIRPTVQVQARYVPPQQSNTGLIVGGVVALGIAAFLLSRR